MPKPDFCVKTLHLRKMLREGRIVAARQQAADWLRDGNVSPQLLALVAELIDPSRQKRSRRRLPPPQWSDIGEAFLALRADGFIRQQAILILADRFHRSVRTIEKALAHHRSMESDRTSTPLPATRASGTAST
ncbi:hypothetical protein LMIY3S_03137 [Labrys miyagiensis]